MQVYCDVIAQVYFAAPGHVLSAQRRLPNENVEEITSIPKTEMDRE
jgi:hypothetical protein